MSPVQLVQLLLLWQYLCLVSSSASSATFFSLTLEKKIQTFYFLSLLARFDPPACDKLRRFTLIYLRISY
jgi:hypothetical protein